MKVLYLSLPAMLAYLLVYCVACYHVYFKPGTKRTTKAAGLLICQKTYCAPSFLFPPAVKTGQS